MKNVVVCDIDGFVADFEGQLTLELYKKFGTSAYRNRHLFSLEERYEGEMLKYAQGLTADPNFYYGLPVIGGGANFIGSFLFSKEIVFVSSRPKSAETFTNRWIKKFVDVDMDSYGLFCGVFDKVDFLKDEKEYIDFVVEDNPKNINNLKDAGFTVYCWDQEWNHAIFPRLYERNDKTIMLWSDPSEEAKPYFSETILGV